MVRKEGRIIVVSVRVERRTFKKKNWLSNVPEVGKWDWNSHNMKGKEYSDYKDLYKKK